VATSTSSYMVGITALTGALVYATSGILITDYAAGIAIGALIGSVMGAFIVKKIDAKHLKRYFGYVLIAVSLLMLYKVGGYT